MTEEGVLTFNTHGNTKQKAAAQAWIDDTITDILYGGGKGGGKTYLGCSLIFGDALMYAGTHYFIARKELNDLRRFTIPSIYEVFKDLELDASIYLKWHGQDNFFELPNGSKVFLIAAKYLPGDPDYQRFGSMQMTRGWIEEAGEFSPMAKANLQASIGRWKNEEYGLSPKLLQTCNPAKNYLYIDYYKPHKAGKLDPWKKFIQALPHDNKRLAKGYLENLIRTLTKKEKQRLVDGNWEYEDDPSSLMDYDSIISIFTNTHVQGTGKKYMSVDVARFGRDKTRIRVFDGWKVIYKEGLENKSTKEVADRIKELQRQYQVPPSNTVIDEDGIGGGVVDNFPKNSVKGFIANSKPINPKEGESYENLKAQCSYKLAEKVKNKEVYEEEDNPEAQERLIEDLEQVKEKSTDSQGKRGVVSKKEVIAILGRSPDDGDTMMMRAIFELIKVGVLRVI
jgi:phage terminase large subunit